MTQITTAITQRLPLANRSAASREARVVWAVG